MSEARAAAKRKIIYLHTTASYPWPPGQSYAKKVETKTSNFFFCFFFKAAFIINLQFLSNPCLLIAYNKPLKTYPEPILHAMLHAAVSHFLCGNKLACNPV